jgi:hypothetical protein
MGRIRRSASRHKKLRSPSIIKAAAKAGQAAAIGLLLIALIAGCIERKPERLARRESPVTTALEAMVQEIREVRANPDADSLLVAEIEARHRRNVLAFCAQALIREPEDLFRASYLLMPTYSTTGPEIHLLGHFMALEALRKGREGAQDLAAQHLNAYLEASGLPKRFGRGRAQDTSDVADIYPFDTLSVDSLSLRWLKPLIDSLDGQPQADSE